VVSVITKKGEGRPPGFTTEAAVSALSCASFGGNGHYNYQFNVDHFHAGSVPVTPIDCAQGEARNKLLRQQDLLTKLGTCQ
jgi:hypothetical protein